MKRVVCRLLFALASVAISSPANADDTPPQMPVVHSGYWERDDARFFAATTIDVGYLYLRPRLSLGYGRPFSTWTGVDVNPIVTSTGVGGWAGVRVQVPWFDVRAGARPFYSFQYNYLAPQAAYETVNLDTATGVNAKYVTLEAELSGGIPAGPGTILLVLTASAVEGTPPGMYVYEETLRVITDPPEIFRARTGYALRFGDQGAAKLGVVGEVLELPRRHDQVWRAGIVASFAIDDHLEALGLLVLPVASPDSIGIAGGDFGELGLRYRWATSADPR
jgi:hypothetical protein